MSAKISILRWLRMCARGTCVVLGYRVTSRDSTPRRDRRIDEVKPAPPPPTIRMGTSTSYFFVISLYFLVSSVTHENVRPEAIGDVVGKGKETSAEGGRAGIMQWPARLTAQKVFWLSPLS